MGMKMRWILMYWIRLRAAYVLGYEQSNAVEHPKICDSKKSSSINEAQEVIGVAIAIQDVRLPRGRKKADPFPLLIMPRG
jgi:hypothetical protein